MCVNKCKQMDERREATVGWIGGRPTIATIVDATRGVITRKKKINVHWMSGGRRVENIHGI